MDCLRSFSVGISQNRTFNSAGVNVKTWGTLGNLNWVVNQAGSSFFQLQGYKRIDLYGIEMLGNVQTDVGLNDAVVVSDFFFNIGIAGQIPLVSGENVIAPNFWAINPNIGGNDLTKYRNKVTFETPYTGCTAIGFNRFGAQGIGGETLNSISLDIDLQFVFYYKYDGE